MALEAITFWHWWALGGVLMFVELFASGFFFLWLGAAAALVGLALIGWSSMPATFQLLLFAGLAFSSLLAWRRLVQSAPPRSSDARLNSGGAQFVGRHACLIDPIQNGRGRIKLGDSSWTVSGPALPAGSAVEVVAARGTILEVRQARADPAGAPAAVGAQASGPAGLP